MPSSKGLGMPEVESGSLPQAAGRRPLAESNLHLFEPASFWFDLTLF
jgi:hypothetical protein